MRFWLLLCASIASAQSWSGIIDSTRAQDWTSAGATIATRSAVCASVTSASTLAQINAAVVTCNGTNQVLSMGAGTYNLAGAIDFSQCANGCSNFTLRGAGPTQTILHFTNNSGCLVVGGAHICVYNGSSRYNTATASYYGTPGGSGSCVWYGGFAQNTSTVAFNNCGADVASFAAGDLIVMDQLDNQFDHAGDATKHYEYACQLYAQGCASDSTGSPAGAGGQGRCGTSSNTSCVAGTMRGQMEIAKVTSVTGPTTSGACAGSGTNCYLVGLSTGLRYTNWNLSAYSSNAETRSPGMWWLGHPIHDVGIENLTVDSSGDTANGNLSAIPFVNALNCWIKNVRLLSGKRNDVWFYDASHITVQDSYFEGLQGDGSQSYAIEAYGAADVLVQNNIFQRVTIPYIFDQSVGAVVAYNYSLNQAYSLKTWGQASQYAHGEGSEYDLYEGNDGFGLIGDQIHGTHHLLTGFRNRWTGYFPGITQEAMAIHLQTHSRVMNMIGNVLGTQGYHTNYLDCVGSAPCIASPDGKGDVSVIAAGWCGNEGQDSSTFACVTTQGMTDDANVYTTLMLWGNYDVVNLAVRWNSAEVPSSLTEFANALPASHTLPNSMYLCGSPCTNPGDGKPSAWWGTPYGTPSWPPNGPDVTGGNLKDDFGNSLGGFANKVPARLCYENTGLDSSLSGTVSNVTGATAALTNGIWVVTLTVNQSLTYADAFRLAGATSSNGVTLNGDHLLYSSGSVPDPLSGTSIVFAVPSNPGTITLSSATITRNPVQAFDASVCYTSIASSGGSVLSGAAVSSGASTH